MDARFITSLPRTAGTLCVLLAVVSIGSAADLTLRPRVATASGLVRLGDIADIADPDGAEAARLARLPLMPAPAPGTETIITAQGVRELVVASGEELNNLRFSGAIRIAIADAHAEPRQQTEAERSPRTFATPAGSEAASEAASETASRTAPKQREQSGFRLVGPTPEKPSPRRVRSTLPRGEATRLTSALQQSLSDHARQQTGDPMMGALQPEIEARHLKSLSRARSAVKVATTSKIVVGRQRFLVSFDTHAGPVRFPVYADVRPATPAVVAVRPVPRGRVITRADVEVRPLPIDARTRPDTLLFATIDEVVGKEAGGTLRAETLLTDKNCLPPMMVRRGQEVSIVSGGGGIRVRMQAEAKANGRLGEIVPVETYNTDERLMARVVGPRQLAVLSSGRSAYTASLPRSRR